DSRLLVERHAQLLANVANVGLQQVGVAALVAPRVFNQTGVWNHPVGVHREHEQDAELERRELNRLVVPQGLMRLEVENQIPDPQLAYGLAIGIGSTAA